jgi:hypothetical protein
VPIGYLFLGALPKWLLVLIQAGVTVMALTVLLFASLILTALATSLAPGGLARPWHDVSICTLVGGTAMLIALFYASTS